MTSRREARESRERAEAQRENSFDDLLENSSYEPHPKLDRRGKPRRPLLKSGRFWVPLASVLLLLGGAVFAAFTAKTLYDEAMAAKNDLEKAIPLVSVVQQQILDGDVEGAKASVDEISQFTASAAAHTTGQLWMNSEWVPVLGPNLVAVRIAATSADDLVQNAVTPMTSFSLNALLPKDGAIDVAQLSELVTAVETASESIRDARENLDSIDRDALVAQVDSGVTKLDDALTRVEPILEPLHDTLAMLPKALGSEGERNYLLLVQNNAESRGSGGNPAAIARLTANDGKISLVEQASSADFNNNRPSPIIDLDPETKALYGTKIGRFVQDTTLTPDFSETAELVRAFWSESFGTPIDAVISMDPVALSYLLEAIGPVTLVTGDELTADTAVDMLLSDIYWRTSSLPRRQATLAQDAFFASAAATVFDAMLSQSPDPKRMVEMLLKAADEGRILYAPSDPEEAAFIAGTRVSGTLPTDNTEATVTGVYVNDITEGKLDYYLQVDIDATSTQCEASDPTFTTTTTLTNTIDPASARSLPWHVSTARYFPKGVVSTDLVVYGPVGATVAGAKVNGESVSVTEKPHLGRPAVKINVRQDPGNTATVEVTYQASAGEYGPLEVRHTPMVRDTPVTTQTPGCAAD